MSRGSFYLFEFLRNVPANLAVAWGTRGIEMIVENKDIRAQLRRHVPVMLFSQLSQEVGVCAIRK
jgi:hypothetical protein